MKILIVLALCLSAFAADAPKVKHPTDAELASFWRLRALSAQTEANYWKKQFQDLRKQQDTAVDSALSEQLGGQSKAIGEVVNKIDCGTGTVYMNPQAENGLPQLDCQAKPVGVNGGK